MRQNDVMTFFVYIPRIIYNIFLVNRQDGLYKAVLLLFCCRSGSALRLYQSAGRFCYAVKCSECTLLFFSVNSLQSIVFNNHLNIKDNRRGILRMSNFYDYNIFIDRRIQYAPATCTTNGAVTLTTLNINNKVYDRNIQTNNEKEISFDNGDILFRDYPCASWY